MSQDTESRVGLLRQLPDWADRAPNERELRVLETVYQTFAVGGTWPQVAHVEATLFREHEVELDELLAGFPFGLLWPEPTTNRELRDEVPLETTLLGLSFVPAARGDVELFLAIFTWSVDLWMQYT